ASQGVDYVRENTLNEFTLFEALAEKGIALWRVGEHQGAFDTWEEAATLLASIPIDTDAKKSKFAMFGHATTYIARDIVGEMASSLSGENFVTPFQGMFAKDNDKAAGKYMHSRRYLLYKLMAMFAENVKNERAAEDWNIRAFEAVVTEGSEGQL